MDPDGNKAELWEPMLWDTRTKVLEVLAMAPDNSWDEQWQTLILA
jgi:hypothetical protein